MSCILCNSRTSKEANRTFHRFPLKNESLLGEWLKAINPGSWKPYPASRVCSAHFEESCFETYGGRKRLKQNSVPTIISGGVRCVVCSSPRQSRSGKGFYKFPINKPNRLKKWISGLGFSETWAPTETSVVCSDHFEPKCFKATKGRIAPILKESGVPTLGAVESAPIELDLKVEERAPNEPYLCEATGLFIMPEPLEPPSTSTSTASLEPSGTDDCAVSTNECTTSEAPASPLNSLNTPTVSLDTEGSRVHVHDHAYSLGSMNILKKKLEICRMRLKKKQRQCKTQAQHIRRLKQTITILKQVVQSEQAEVSKMSPTDACAAAFQLARTLESTL